MTSLKRVKVFAAILRRGCALNIKPMIALFAILPLLAMILANSAAAKSLHHDYKLLRGELQQYGDWLVGCDNNAECTIIGFPKLSPQPKQQVTNMVMRIRLIGEADAIPIVDFFPAREELNSTLALPITRFHLVTEPQMQLSEAQFGFSGSILNESAGQAAIDELLAYREIVGIEVNTNRLVARFPKNDFTRAYRAMNARRASLIHAIDRSMAAKKESDIPQRERAVPAIVSGIVNTLTSNLCGANSYKNVQRFLFSGGAELWRYECENMPSISKSYWGMAKTTSDGISPLDLPEPRDHVVRAGTDGLDNAIFDFDFGILRAYQYMQGRTDCGVFRVWGYTNQGWKLLERREMPLCKGLEPHEWVRTYFAPTGGAGQDE